jgi:hypothetical protein
VDEARLREALTERTRHRLRNDSTLSHLGHVWELDQGYLAGRSLTVAHCWLDQPPAPWVEHEGKVHPLRPVDPKANAERRRQHNGTSKIPQTGFNPPDALLHRAVGRALKNNLKEE